MEIFSDDDGFLEQEMATEVGRFLNHWRHGFNTPAKKMSDANKAKHPTVN